MHVLAERFDHFFVVVDSAHARVADFHEVLIAEVFGNARANLDKTIVNIVEFGLVRFERSADRFASRFSHFAVAVVHKAADETKRFFLAAPVDFDRRHKHRILGDDRVFFLFACDGLFVVSLSGALEVFEESFGEQRLEFGAERAVEQQITDLGGDCRRDRSDLVVIVLLADIELVLGVEGVARVCERSERSVLLLFREVLSVSRFHRFCARCRGVCLFEFFRRRFEVFDLVTAVRQVFTFYYFVHNFTLRIYFSFILYHRLRVLSPF